MSALGAALLWLATATGPMVPGTGNQASPDDRRHDLCVGPADQRAPDPRCGEALDGRASPADASASLKAARAALWLPRAVVWAGLWPVAETSAVVDSHHVREWADAILTTDDGKIGVRPVVNYVTGFLPTGGMRVFFRRLPGEGSEIAARFQTGGAGALLGGVGLRGPLAWGVSALLQASRRADLLFAGIGPHSMDDLESRGLGAARFAATTVGADLHWSRSLAGRLWLGLHGNVLRRDYRADDVQGGPSIATLFTSPTTACAGGRDAANVCVDADQAPGFQTGLRLIHAGGALGFDTRNHDRDGSGVTATIDATYARGVADDPSRHIVVSAEILVAVGGIDRVLILRGRAATVQALGSTRVPFDELVSPAGAAGLRGLAEGRLRGPIGALGTAEYRWYLSSRLDASLFVDIGTVSQRPNLADLGVSRWFPDVGLGLRYHSSSGPHWKWPPLGGLQLAYAPGEGTRLLFSLAPL